MKTLRGALGVVVVGMVLSAGDSGRGQQVETVTIKFKLYDTNKPGDKDPVTPKASALLSVRDQATKRPGFPRTVPVARTDDGFWQIQVEKNVLIEHAVIETESTRYSPADVTKIITRAPMNVYPGVSDSLDQFSISAYGAQMNGYRAIITDLNTALPGQRGAIRELLGAKFRQQLTNMAAAAEDATRLLTSDSDEIAAAKKLAREVLELYGLETPTQEAEPLVICPPHLCDNAMGCATIIVHVPEKARLAVEGERTSSRGHNRVFITPPLVPNRAYKYMVRRVMLVEGKEQVRTKEVPVRAFCITDVDFR